MPYRDEAGAEHVSATDPITVWSQLHIQDCEHCRADLFTKLIRNENNMGISNLETTEDRRPVEDELNELSDIDNHIREMLAKREALVNRIKKANAVNTERVNTSEDWFEGDLRGRPVPARSGMEVPMEARSIY